jgi:hypothetical protein
MDGTEDHVKQNKPNRKRQIFHILSHMWNLDQNKQTNKTTDMSIKQELFGEGNEWEGEGKRRGASNND